MSSEATATAPAALPTLSIGVTRLIYLAIAAIALVLLGIGVFAPTKSPTLRVFLETEDAGSLQVYFDMGKGLSEPLSSHAKYAPGVNRLTLEIPDGTVKAMRLDPSPGARAIRLHRVSIESPRSGEVIDIPLETVTAGSEVESIQYGKPGAFFDFSDPSRDPQLWVALQRPFAVQAENDALLRTKNLLLSVAVLLLMLVLALSRPASRTATWLTAVLLLIVAMGALTTAVRSVHPDEYSHVAASKYYFAHWAPPGAEDPRIVESYTPYGTSYLNELDVVYFFAGKVSGIWSHLTQDDTAALRWFNALLFALLMLWAWNRREVWPGAALLLITPQVWYLFSYFNADAFPLFLAFVLAFLYAAPASGVSRFVEDGHRAGRMPVLAAILFAATLGLLLVSKHNYLPVVFAAGLFLSVRHLRLPVWAVAVASLGAALFVLRYAANLNIEGMSPHLLKALVPTAIVFFLVSAVGLLRPVWNDASLRPKLARLVLLFVVACVIAFPRILMDRRVNGDGENKHRILQALAETHAIPGLKPSAIANGTGESLPGHNLAEKGVGYFEIFGEDRDWAGTSWESTIGVYGYMEIRSAEPVYWLISIGFVLLLAHLLRRVRREKEIRPAFAVAFFGIALTVLSSTIYSWVVDFQPQGRYLLPGMAILAAVLIAHPGLMRSRLPSVAIALCFFGSLCSFVLYALPQLIMR